MSANSARVKLPIRKVVLGDDGQYRVYELIGITFTPVSKPYGHSTSAFAALGRLTQTDTKEAAGHMGAMAPSHIPGVADPDLVSYMP